MNRTTSIMEVKGIGPKTLPLYHGLHLETAEDLLLYFPRDYDTLKPPVNIADIRGGEKMAVRGTVSGSPTLRKLRRLTLLEVVVRDGTGELTLVFFNMPFLKKILFAGSVHIFRGILVEKGRERRMEQPTILKPSEYNSLCSRIQPIYPLTKGLTNGALQKSVRYVLEHYTHEEEYYPAAILDKERLISRKDALWTIHFPTGMEELVEARRRLVFDEFLDFILLMRLNRERGKKHENSFPMQEFASAEALASSLPYALTGAQTKVWREIQKELAGEGCMNRLIQGDVGSGKTLVAVLALLQCAESGWQGALMAPTEVLALQHYETILQYTRDYALPFRPLLLVGSMTAKEKRLAYEAIQSGEANLVIGTHALIQEKVVYKNLALVITDEQHRFGVRQREELAGKGRMPHVLVMSATPIPRTLAIILYGDMEFSVIDELPAKRLPIKNCVVNPSYRPKAYAFMEKEIQAGHQIYVICPQVEEGELDDVENVMSYADKLKENMAPSIRISPLHGKMKPAEKNKIMEAFGAGEIDVLVSTTVIEVGINVPNATVMMVENADRFGLAQLHQLRGRVGRGQAQSYCIFVNTRENRDTSKRLEILNTSNDGFFIASEDLRLRGPGELFGLRQSGEFAFRIGDIYTDAGLLERASAVADAILEEDPHLLGPVYEGLKHHLSQSPNAVDFRSI